MGVTLFFLEKKSDDLFVIASEIDDLFLANVNSLYVIVRPSVVCLSSVCNVRAPYADD